MTTKQTIKILDDLRSYDYDKIHELYQDKPMTLTDALNMAIKALQEQEDGEHDGCKDCVYQANPQDAMPCRECKHNYMDKWKARPKEEPKVGKWLGVNKNTWCNNCAIAISQYIKGDFTIDAENLPNYCPNCGAKMGGEQDG